MGGKGRKRRGQRKRKGRRSDGTREVRRDEGIGGEERRGEVRGE